MSTAHNLIDYVPQDTEDHLRWRIRMREVAAKDRHVRQALYSAAMDDLPFFLAAFCWLMEPRAEVKTIPFVPWPHQIPVARLMDETITESQKGDVPVALTLPKSRAQGATYLYVYVLMRRWLRDRLFSAGIVTRNEQLVDSKTDTDAILWKIWWGLEQLPVWMQPRGLNSKEHRSLTDHTIVNPENGAIILGYSATGDVARGGRKTLFVLDEIGSEEFSSAGKDYKALSAVSHVTKCLAEGTLVVTDRGPVPIEKVALTDRVWDGKVWVSHDGCVFQGWRETIRSYRIRLTPDHQIFTVKGCRDASAGIDREEVRLPDGYRKKWLYRHQFGVVVPLRLRKRDNSSGRIFVSRPHDKLRLLEAENLVEGQYYAQHDGNAGLLFLGWHDPEMHQSGASALPRLRRTGNYGLRALAGVPQLSGGYGRETQGVGARPAGQQRGLLQGELPVGNATATGEQQAQQPPNRNINRDAEDTGDCRNSGGELRCNHHANQEGSSWGRSSVPGSVFDTRTEAVYDLLNCGPRRAFTVIDDGGRPLLVSNCIFLVSTFGGESGVFYEAAEDLDNPRLIRLDWKDNPTQTRNAYVTRQGVAVAADPAEQAAVTHYARTSARQLKKLEGRGHVLEGKFRSPWYDSYCLLPGATPRYIARELDMNPRGAVGKVFALDVLDRMREKCCRPPAWQGRAVFDGDTLELRGLIKQPGGPLSLWFEPGLDNSPPPGRFGVGCDIAAGGHSETASNSVASGVSLLSGEQIMEYVVRALPPTKFARIVAGLCRWLHNAYLGWELTGPTGSTFGHEIMDVLRYGNIYYRDVDAVGETGKHRTPGWANRTDQDKERLFDGLGLAMEEDLYTPRSEEMIIECGEYEWVKGKISHRASRALHVAPASHGDRCISAGVANLLLGDRRSTIGLDRTLESMESEPPYGCLAWRMGQAKLRSGGDDSGEEKEFDLRSVLGIQEQQDWSE